MARISLDPPRSLALRMGEWYSRRRFGAALDPALAMGHNKKVFRTYVKHEMSAQKWSGVPEGVKTLAVMSAAATVVGSNARLCAVAAARGWRVVGE